MARLFVGQMVRIVHSLCGNEGKTGRITEVRHDALIRGYGIVGVAYRCDRDDGDYGWGPAHFYEPILPYGHVAGEDGRCKPLDHLLSRLKGVEA